MPHVKTFDNSQSADSGLILPSDLNSIQDDYEAAFTTWKTWATVCGEMDHTAAGASIWLGRDGASVPNSGPMPAWDFAVPFDPASVDAGTRSVGMRLFAGLYFNQTAPVVNLRIQAATFTDCIGTTDPLPNFSGTNVGTVATAPAAHAALQAYLLLPDAASATHYILGMSWSGAAAAGSKVNAVISLQYRQV